MVTRSKQSAALILLGIASLALVACQGPQGETGPQGQKGEVGPQGPQGEPGRTPTNDELLQLINQVIGQKKEELRGPSGPKGDRGPQGERGPTGATGSTGLTGPQGPKGDNAADISDYLPKLREAVVYVESGASKGSGIRISQNEILTAKHVLGSSSTANISVKGEGRVLATVKGYDTDRDIALLAFSSTKQSADYVSLPTTFFVSDSSGFRLLWELGSAIAAIGYAPDISTTTPVITFGRIGVLWSVVPGDINQGQADAAVTEGMSGGGVFNDHGELIGIIQSRSTTFDGETRFLTASEINEVIADLRAGTKR